MSTHVTTQQIEQFRNKGMTAEDLLAFDRHLAQCGECRKQLANGERVKNLLSGLAAADAAPDHLSYDQMAAYVDAKADDIDREIVESHVELCERCATELGDLAAFAQTLTTEAEPSPLVTRYKTLGGAISMPKKVILALREDENKKH